MHHGILLIPPLKNTSTFNNICVIRTSRVKLFRLLVLMFATIVAIYLPQQVCVSRNLSRRSRQINAVNYPHR